MKDAKYNLFLRNWVNGIAQESHLDKAVELGYISADDKKEIMNSTRN
ncbi:hypothetical protein NCCP2716_27940 [Sporosarcina sp. NCCP-2716]|nr:hypothetical protein [Sporosarcina sp. NCCP-2716]GKV70296.1 hypothetical protein NCCP2716_27940 [Sporosarcina sp. NCCP-2716]